MRYNYYGDKMIYLVYGSQQPLVDKEIARLVKENLTEVNDFSLITFDMDETLLQDIIDDASTLPFGVDNKVIIVKNASIFQSNSSKKEKLEHDTKCLLNYYKNPSPFSTLIFVVNSSSVDERKDVFKDLRKAKGVITKIADVDKKDWPRVIKQLVTARKIDFDSKALEEFINRTSGDLHQVVQELDKLKIYGEKITLDVVEGMVARPLEENMFGMVDAILANNPSQALSIYNDLRAQNEDPARLVPALANQFRFLYKVGYLNQQGCSDSEIASLLGVNNPYRIVFSKKKIGRRKTADILAIISDLAELDYMTKTGQIDRFRGFELFIIGEH